MAGSSEDRSPELVITARPQISLELNEYDEIVISTASIGDDYRTVEHDEIKIPMESVAEIIAALQQMLDSRSGR